MLCFGATTRGLSADAGDRPAVAHLMGARHCAYVALLDASDATLVGKATTFVTNGPAVPFDALEGALRELDR